MRRPGIRSLAGGAAGIVAGVIGGIALTSVSAASGPTAAVPGVDHDDRAGRGGHGEGAQRHGADGAGTTAVGVAFQNEGVVEVLRPYVGTTPQVGLA